MTTNNQYLPENLEDVKDFQCCFNSMSKESGDVEKQEDSEAVQIEPSVEENEISGNIAPENEPAISEIPNTPEEIPDEVFEALLKRAFTVKRGEITKALFEGKWQESGYKNPESAVSALCHSLAWIMSGNESAIDKAFRRSKLFDPAVWDQDVGGGISRRQLHVKTAIERCKKSFFKGDPFSDGKKKNSGKKNPDGSPQPEPKSQATLLVEIGLKSELFYSGDTSYATIQINGHYETWAINSKGFRKYLYSTFFKTEGKAANAESVRGAMNTLSAIADDSGVEKPVFNRIARLNGNIYIDLCDASWEIVKISSEGWEVVKDPSVKFIRSANAGSLPCPIKGGNINDFKRVLNNISDENFCLLIGWLIGAHIHDLQYPILVFSGTQGTAKSVTSRMVKSLVDPNKTLLRKLPKDSRDLMIAAKYNHCLAFDNISGLSAEVSDDLCRLSTGAGLGTRTLFENDEETVFEAKRPVILNGIDAVGSRSDLAERSIVVELDIITKRRRETEVVKDFENISPGILGALYDALSVALKNECSVSRDDFPRMADFAAWAVAAQPALPFKEGLFLEAYSDNRQILIENSIQSDPTARVSIAFMEDRIFFEGTASDLLDELNKIASDSVKKEKKWAKSPSALSRNLKRSMPFLRESGFIIEFEPPARRGEKNKSHGRGITISKE